MKSSEALPKPIKGGGSPTRGIGSLSSKAAKDLESGEVRHRRSQKGLQFGLAPAPVERLPRAEVVKVIDLPLDDRTPSQLGLDRGSLLLGSCLMRRASWTFSVMLRAPVPLTHSLRMAHDAQVSGSKNSVNTRLPL